MPRPFRLLSSAACLMDYCMTSDQGKDRFPKNAPGPFFVANGECIACMAPEREAPDLMGFDQEATHCYFRKQPSTQEELERAARAVWVSYCGAQYYSGDDPTVHRRIADLQKQTLNRMRRRANEKRPWWKFW